MSVNISRFVETTLKERTTVYSPLIEAIVNSIEAISESKRLDGQIIIMPKRSAQMSLESDALPDIVGFTIEDNGVGFNKKKRDAFDELFTDYKVNIGGKGIGRFIFLKYFSEVEFRSVYRNNGKYNLRRFRLGSHYDIIENETDQEVEASDTNTRLILDGLKQYGYDKELKTVARKILEKILVFFVDDTFKCPTIILKENDSEIILNDFLGTMVKYSIFTVRNIH